MRGKRWGGGARRPERRAETPIGVHPYSQASEALGLTGGGGGNGRGNKGVKGVWSQLGKLGEGRAFLGEECRKQLSPAPKEKQKTGHWGKLVREHKKTLKSSNTHRSLAKKEKVGKEKKTLLKGACRPQAGFSRAHWQGDPCRWPKRKEQKRGKPNPKQKRGNAGPSKKFIQNSRSKRRQRC